MRNILLKLEFDGTNYHGWQKQKNALTIQQVVEDVLKQIMKEDIDVIGCSRTDAGVHAYEYVCNFKCNNSIPANKIPYALNSILPDDIAILEAKEVNENFHSRYNTIKKTYCYKVLNRPFKSAFKGNYTYHWPYDLDIKGIIEASKCFIGKKDFKAFMASGSSVNNTIRNITNISIQIPYEDMLYIYITGDGFLYNMVRIIVGTLLFVGNGKLNKKELIDIIESKDRKRAGVTVPPQGLYLYKVYLDLKGDN